MIRSFADETTADIWRGIDSKAARRIQKALWSVISRKLDTIDAATQVSDLRFPLGNNLHGLKHGREGTFAIKVNQQYRITFRFEQDDAYGVCCEDYHDN
jgi:proteic killer suppression protein